MVISVVIVWLDVIRRVVEVFFYVYKIGFVYNDIKGNNVVLDNRDGIKYNFILIDFGKSLLVIGFKGFKNFLVE